MIIGYVCKGACDEEVNGEILTLTKFGCKEIIKDNFRDMKKKLDDLNLFDSIHKNDVLVVQSAIMFFNS